MKKIIIIMLMFFLFSSSYAIVPPRNKNIKIPAYMLENLKKDPGYYMPKKGLLSQVKRFREQKKARRLLNGDMADSFQAPYLQANIPVLCAQYSDVDPEWPVAQMQNKLFGDWSTGSMRDYYDEVSYGQFKLTGQVYGWYKVSGNTAYYNERGSNDDNIHLPDLLLEVFQAADDSIDFGLYDNDGPDGIPNSGDDDGYVDVIAVIHSGGGGEEGGNAIHSHSSRYPFVTNDAAAGGGSITILDYIIQPAIESRQMVEIGVFCHEFGHALGLPDLYDGDYSSEGVGDWCLMAGGSWGGDGSSPEYPAHMSAWCKEQMGWIEPVVLDKNVYNQLIPAVVDTPVVYKVWTKGQIEYPETNEVTREFGREYFLVENRQQTGFDVKLHSSGLLIWHVDNNVYRRYYPNNSEDHKLVDLEEADARRDLDFTRNRGDDGDPFPGKSGNRFFNRTSNPNSLDYFDEGTKVGVGNISDSADSMYADLEIIARDIIYESYVMNDNTGDGNGFLDPGETAQLILKLKNYGESVNSVSAVLRTQDPDISITDSTAVYYNLLEDAVIGNESDVFEISASPEAKHHPVKCVLSLSGEDGYQTDLNVIVMMENIFILLVDDSRGETDENGVPIINYYTNALNELEINYYTPWSTLQKGSPDINSLKQYGTVLWFTASQAMTLSADEQETLKTYLAEGGDMFISGQNIGDDLVTTGNESSIQFFENTLHARHIQDNATDQPVIMLTGIAEDPISDVYRPYFFIAEGDGANNNTSASIIEPDEYASPVFNYFGTGLMGKKAAIKYRGEDYKLVYFAFSFEAINEYGSKNVTRKDVLGKVINWLQGVSAQTGVEKYEKTDKAVLEFALLQNYPNPFNPQTTISYQIPKKTVVSIVVFDVLGREIKTLVDGPVPPGAHDVVWNGLDNFGRQAATGVYFYRINTEKFSQIRKMILLR
ncbi:M6 family metalloprotease domain-containing protein [candidate division KSB1 bacterium]|nr:M6 family metalloprotease domain-containing protein [candidate division KSB1 bacterium]